MRKINLIRYVPFTSILLSEFYSHANLCLFHLTFYQVTILLVPLQNKFNGVSLEDDKREKFNIIE